MVKYKYLFTNFYLLKHLWYFKFDLLLEFYKNVNISCRFNPNIIFKRFTKNIIINQYSYFKLNFFKYDKTLKSNDWLRNI
jgi:hypothetical protein